jgi:hypothetical protein
LTSWTMPMRDCLNFLVWDMGSLRWAYDLGMVGRKRAFHSARITLVGGDHK